MVRTRFLVVPLVVLGPFAGYAAALQVSEALAERDSRQRELAYERAVAPAENAVRAVRLDGMTGCARPHPTEVLCVTGKVQVKAAHAALERALRDAGATGVATRCRELPGRSVCFVEATLHGSDVLGMVAHEMVAGKPTSDVTATVTVNARV